MNHAKQQITCTHPGSGVALHVLGSAMAYKPTLLDRSGEHGPEQMQPCVFSRSSSRESRTACSGPRSNTIVALYQRSVPTILKARRTQWFSLCRLARPSDPLPVPPSPCATCLNPVSKGGEANTSHFLHRDYTKRASRDRTRYWLARVPCLHHFRQRRAGGRRKCQPKIAAIPNGLEFSGSCDPLEI